MFLTTSKKIIILIFKKPSVLVTDIFITSGDVWSVISHKNVTLRYHHNTKMGNYWPQMQPDNYHSFVFQILRTASRYARVNTKTFHHILKASGGRQLVERGEKV